MVYNHLVRMSTEGGLVLREVAARYTSNVDLDLPKDRSAEPILDSSSQGTATGSSQELDGGVSSHAPTDSVSPTMRPQYLRAYRYWHKGGMSLERMCAELSLKGKVKGVDGAVGEKLKASTVMFVLFQFLVEHGTEQLLKQILCDICFAGRHCIAV